MLYLKYELFSSPLKSLPRWSQIEFSWIKTSFWPINNWSFITMILWLFYKPSFSNWTISVSTVFLCVIIMSNFDAFLGQVDMLLRFMASSRKSCPNSVFLLLETIDCSTRCYFVVILLTLTLMNLSTIPTRGFSKPLALPRFLILN